MRVVQMLPNMNIGGVERGVVELSKRLVETGTDSIVLSRGGALCDDVVSNGGRHIVFDCASKNILTVPKRVSQLRTILADIAPDIVHVRSRVPAWLLAFARGRFAVVSTFHGIYSVNRYSAQMTRAAAVICPSRAVWKHITHHYQVAEEKLHLIHRGVDWQYFDPAAIDDSVYKTMHQQLRLSGHTVFAIVGRVSPRKGHDLLLQAFAALKQSSALGKPPLLLIVGDEGGKRSQRLQEEAQRLGVADVLRFAGIKRQMREVYACCDVVVSASTRPEAFGRSVTEALAMERAAVAPAHGGALDIIDNGKNGVLFRPADSEQLTQALVQAAALPREGLRESVADFTLAHMAEKTQAVYQSLAT